MADIDVVANWAYDTSDIEFPKTGKPSTITTLNPLEFEQQYEASPIEPNSEEQAKDELGYTNPNLHRRIEDVEDRERGHSYFIDPTEEEISTYGLNLDVMAPNEYSLRLHNVYSYRTTTVCLHDDSLDGGPGTGENEIP